MGRSVAQDAQEAEVAVNNKREILSGKVEKLATYHGHHPF